MICAAMITIKLQSAFQFHGYGILCVCHIYILPTTNLLLSLSMNVKNHLTSDVKPTKLIQNVTSF